MKPVQNFDAKNLGWMRRYRKQFHLTPDKGPKPTDASEWGAFLKSLQRDIALGTMKFTRLHSSVLVRNPRPRVILSTKSLDESLVLRKINDNLRRSYGIRGTNRGEAVTTLMQALGENTPKAIYRVDIKSCFESISRSAVLKKLRGDGLVSYQTIALVDQIFERAATLRPKVGKRGLPRGLILSGTLAEIYLIAMDKALRDIEGVYLVVRYVDDFVVMSSGSIEALTTEVRRVLAQLQLRPNPKKTKPYFVGCKCSEECPHGAACPCAKTCACGTNDARAIHRLEYLGYELRFSAYNVGRGTNDVRVVFSEAKIKKLKTRIFLAARAYIKSGDIQLYIDRLSFLTGNQMMLSSSGKRGLFTGIAYSHPLYAPGESDARTQTLQELDLFLQRTTRFALRNRATAVFFKEELVKLNFAAGFNQRRRTKFSAARMGAIARCWSNV